MNNKGKVSMFLPIVLLILFSFAILGAAAFLWFSYEKEKNTNIQLSKQLTILGKDKDKMKELLETSNKEKLLLEEKVSGHDIVVAKLNEKITSETEAKLTLRKEREDLINKMMEVRSENNYLKKQVEEKHKEVAELENDLGVMIAQYDKVKKSTSSEEKLEAIVVSPTTVLEQSASKGASASEGESTKEAEGTAVAVGIKTGAGISASVLSVNREHAFLVINAGKKSGINIGDIFDVFHEGAFIGKVQIEQSRDTLSSANFLDNFKADLASKNDIVRRTK